MMDKDKNYAPPRSFSVMKRHWLPTLTTILLGIIVLTMLLLGNGMRKRQYQNHILMNAVEDVQLHISLFYLGLEKYLSGNRAKSIETIFSYMEIAEVELQIMIEGGTTDHGTSYPLKDPLVIEKVRGLQAGVNKLKEDSTILLKKSEESRAGSTLENAFDSDFENFLNNAKRLEALLIVNAKQYMDRSDSIIMLVIIAWTWAMGLAVFVLILFERRRARIENDIMESEEKYSSLFNNMLNGFSYHKMVLDEDNRPVDYIFLDINSCFETLTGLHREDIIGKRATEVFPEIKESKFDWIGEYGKIAMEGGELRTEQYSESLQRWHSILAYSNRKGFLAVVFEDITERRLTEEALKASETKYRLIHNAAFDGIIIASNDDKIIECNKSAGEIFGYEDNELIDMRLTDLVPEEYRRRHLEGIRRFCETGVSEIQGTILELHGLRKDGEIFPIELILGSFELNDKLFFSGTIRDITERKNSEESIERLAYYDHLTGLPNRLLFKERLNQALLRETWRKRNIAVLFIDLYRFKAINDTFGHAFGDELLKVVSTRLQECLRDGDTVARLGGDEFTLILHDLAKAEDISIVLEKILHSIKQPIKIKREEVFIGTSIGVSIFPGDGIDSETLLKNADTAMYRAKSEGKNNFQFYTQAMSTKAIHNLKMEHRLSRALEKDEFILHYQPAMDLRTSRIVGMEALVRLYDSSEDNIIRPGDFIPVAKDTGIIIPLSEWVLRTACMHNKSYQDAGYTPIKVAVNISPKVFKQKDFTETVVKILNETGLKPEYLEIEITEETMMIDVDDSVKTMNALRKLGVRFSIDDFGTGYSSLSYLKMLPIEMLKIDRAFIHDLSTNPDDKAIVTAIIRMAHSMDIEVLAEGVETEEQVKFLNSFGCDKFQGYFLSKPISFEKFEEFLKDNPSTKKTRRFDI